MRRSVLIAATVLVAAFLFFLRTLPSRPLALDAPGWRTGERGPSAVVPGAFHVHSDRSDGTGTLDEIAAAAAGTGLKFVIFTDHGDGTRPPEPPRYRSGVLCLDAVEISTTDGHYIALDIPRAPYPLAGEARDVIEDVARLGGFGVVAHPGSPKPELRWREWSAPFEGIEWLNADSEWRDEPRRPIARALLGYFFRPAPSLAALLDRPAEVLARWDVLVRRRRVVALAGVDAHARIGPRGGTDPYENGAFLRLPSYKASFRTFAIRAELRQRLTGDPAPDGEAVLRALRAGHAYTVIDALAAPAAFEFTAESGPAVAAEGDELPAAGVVRLRARANAPASASIALFRDGKIVTERQAPELTYETPPTPGVFRVEVRLTDAPGTPPVPWIVSNPIYIVPAGSPRAIAPPRGPAAEFGVLGGSASPDWRIEKHAGSAGSLERSPGPAGERLAFRYRLARGIPAGQYAALVAAAGREVAAFDRLAFRGRADRPTRLSVQLRLPGSAQGQRWRRSVYLEPAMRERSVFFDEVTPIGLTDTRRPDLTKVESILFVVDTTNTRPGTTGTVWLEDVRLGR